MDAAPAHAGPASAQTPGGRDPTDDDASVEAIRSPDGSDVGSVLSNSIYQSSAGAIGNMSRLGLNQLAGYSSLNLAISGAASPSMSGFNAISTLLNDPGKRPRPIDPSSSRYPAVPPSHAQLPRIKRSSLDPYIDTVKPEWERFLRNQRLGRSGKARLEAQDVDSQAADAAAASGVHAGDTAIEKAHTAATLARSSLEDARLVKHRKRLPPLSAVPQIFFAEDFDLANPYTFDLVTERYKSSPPAAAAGRTDTESHGAYDVALNQMLQEKLSYYSDVVEQHLILEISARSSSFFAALGSLQDLEAEATACLGKVEALKDEVVRKDVYEAKAGLQAIKQQADRRETRDALAAVQAVGQLVDQRDLARLLVQSGDWHDALEVISSVEDVIDGRTSAREGLHRSESSPASASLLPPHLDLELSAVPAVAGLRPELKEFLQSVSTQLEGEVLAILSADLNERMDSASHAVADESSRLEPDRLQQRMQAEAIGAEPGPTSPSAPQPQGAGLEPAVMLARTDGAPLSAAESRLQERLSAVLYGLVRGGGMSNFALAYRAVVMRGIREALRLHIASSERPPDLEGLAALLDDDEIASGRVEVRLSPGAAAAAAALRGMDTQAFLAVSSRLYDGFSHTLEAIGRQIKVVLTSLDALGRRPISGTPQTRGEGGADKFDDVAQVDNNLPSDVPQMPSGVSPALPAILTGLMLDAAALSHVFASRLQSLRAATHVNLSLADFLAVFNQSWNYVLSSEVRAGRMIMGLRGTMLNQAKGWLANFHRQRIEGGAKKVEEETWGQAEVTPDQQSRVNVIVESATQDPQAMLLGGAAALAATSSSEGKRGPEKIDSSLVPAPQESGRREQDPTARSEGVTSKTLSIEANQFFVVAATLHVLGLLNEYMQVIINLPLLTTEAMGRVVEFLKQFNSRTCQVVLGAGAMRSAGLKNITAKHLALASQSLSIMVTLIPYVRETVRRHLNPRQAVMLVEFDKLRRDYQEHQNEIHDKLVAIMSDRLTVHCRNLASISWDATAPDGEDEASKPIQDLIKETVTLHKVLSKYLQPSIVARVMGQVFRLVDQRVGSEFQRAEASSQTALDRLQQDRKTLQARFGVLKQVEWSDLTISDVLKQKKLSSGAESMDERGNSAPAPSPSPRPAPGYKPRITPLLGRKQTSQSPAGSNGQAPGGDVVMPPSTTSDTQPHASRQMAVDRGKALPQEPLLQVSQATMRDQSTGASHGPGEPPTPPSKEEKLVQVAQPSVSETSAPEDGSPGETDEAAPTVGLSPLFPVDSSATKPETNEHATPGPVGHDLVETEGRRDSGDHAKVEGPSTPSKTVRMSLRERLAEAAKARAAAAGQGQRISSESNSRPSTPQTPIASANDPTQFAEKAREPPPSEMQGGASSPVDSVARQIDRETDGPGLATSSGAMESTRASSPALEAHVRGKMDAHSGSESMATPTVPGSATEASYEGKDPASPKGRDHAQMGPDSDPAGDSVTASLDTDEACQSEAHGDRAVHAADGDGSSPPSE